MDYLGHIKDEDILQKTQEGKGLAEVAIGWFWMRHANYNSTTKKFLEEVTVKIDLLNRRVDRHVGSGDAKEHNGYKQILVSKWLLFLKSYKWRQTVTR